MHLWDRLVPQALLTLNLLRVSRINPKLSAYAQVFCQCSYNATPIAQPGTHILVHEKPAQRASWALHAVDTWYLEPALNHYRCYRAWVWSIQRERITDTGTWFPKTVVFQTQTPAETIQHCIQQIVTALSLLKTPCTPVITNDENTAIDHFEDLLSQLPEFLPADMDPQFQRVNTTATEDTEDSSQLQRVPLPDINATEPLPILQCH
jgi:hypothetical protein